MPITRFPDPRLSTREGIVAVGGDLHPDSLLLAYRQGIFPWPIDGMPLTWFCPPRRAIVSFKDLHVPRSLAREQRRTKLRFSIDRAFDRVIEECSRVPRPGQDGTWITDEMIQAYGRLHRLGHAHSVEAWADEGMTELVGGIYGVDAGGAFAGESMFFKQPCASKLALLHLIGHMKSRGAGWLDIQVMTPHMQAMGASLIRRDRFLDLLFRTQARGLTLFDPVSSR